MADGVLDQGLQTQRRDEEVLQTILDLEALRCPSGPGAGTPRRGRDGLEKDSVARPLAVCRVGG